MVKLDVHVLSQCPEGQRIHARRSNFLAKTLYPSLIPKNENNNGNRSKNDKKGGKWTEMGEEEQGHGDGLIDQDGAMENREGARGGDN